jgi:hypothetical protein
MVLRSHDRRSRGPAARAAASARIAVRRLVRDRGSDAWRHRANDQSAMMGNAVPATMAAAVSGVIGFR